jgi:HSP20 family protein
MQIAFPEPRMKPVRWWPVRAKQYTGLFEIIMNTLIRWNPLREFETMQNRMNNFFGKPLLPTLSGENLNISDWTPLVDVEESDKEFTIKAELPEVKKEDVKVQLENGSIRISGERKMEKEESGHRWHRIERNYGAFERTFTLPEETKRSEVKAEFKDGLLRVHLPKGESAKTKALEIPVS